MLGDMPDVDRAIAEVAQTQHGAFSRRQAVAAGATKFVIGRRVAKRTWLDLTEDVFANAAARSTWRLHVMAATLAGPGGVASHRTCAALRRVPGFAENRIEVTRTIGERSTSTHGVVHRTRWLPPWHITKIDGIPVTTSARMLFDLAAVVSFERLERAVDNALVMRIVSLDELHDMLVELAERGRTGIGPMRRILAKRSPGYIPNESELEADFERLLEQAGERIPRRQVDVGGETWVGRVDYRDAGSPVVWEIDGRTHHQQLLDAERDDKRRTELTAAGLVPVRFKRHQIKNQPEWVIGIVRQMRARYSVYATGEKTRPVVSRNAKAPRTRRKPGRT
jgi:very-short-patch-repair endonuclease